MESPPPQPPASVRLQAITAETVRAVLRLAVAPDQQHLVAPNAVSLSQALFAPEAWYRAICCGDAFAGFVMLEDQALAPVPPPEPRITLWRFMIDAGWQGRGVGSAALQAVIRHARQRGLYRRLYLSYVPAARSPEGFYRAHGFLPTGDIDEGEVVMALDLAAPGEPGVRPSPPGRQPAFEAVLSARDVAAGPAHDAIDEGLGAANDAFAPLADVQPLGVDAHDAAGRLLGGANGRTWGDCAELQQLWVAPAHRRRGLGAAIVRRFEAEARARGCRLVYLDTFSFQAPAFYQSLGYRVASAIDGLGGGAVKYAMRKALPAPG
ncbi:GNAT family N-acetyltransferase [Ramlibacter sp.]|uniref:GNAT family N-acetyltransferase n=1 Tax=Ramlibacter sp. TaxID=1917967 RepID=UPI0035B1F42B